LYYVVLILTLQVISNITSLRRRDRRFILKLRKCSKYWVWV